ncbi:hypothetical protein CA13_54050 [Planctomycetes bacterium CA13]|uniref:Uncharacterized protein n=2 Tax=Novipirellula herctigrandis TaxID=2527986 RepID=A0A5C5ZAS6_9BACT|nr:hypothetical protein CA13_54050 [Planctomycetes bacterium CA13]
MLALAILGGSLAILSTIASVGSDAAREGRDLSIARILCQTKLSELLIQDIAPQAVDSVPIESSDSGSVTEFTYSVEVLPAPLDGLLSIRVSVDGVNPDGGSSIASYALTRWMIDPALGLEEAEEAEEAEKAAAESAATDESGGGEF